MDRAAYYLQIPEEYFAGMGVRLRWSADGETVESDDGRTFVFAAAVAVFAEGFAAQRPLIHFGHVLHIMRMLDGQACTLDDPGEAHRVGAAFRAAGRPYRNAGAFFGVVCADVPAPAGPVSAEELARRISLRLLGLASAPSPGGEKPSTGPAVFEAKTLRSTAAFDDEALRHWFRHGRGPVTDEATAVADALRRPPRTLADALADVSRRQRLAGAAAFVEQLAGALALPPRRLARPEMPLGGYADVATRGGPEQILPSQFALDELEFVRRWAGRELLFYRREEPHDRTREELVVLLDQGVRTWGAVRLVLAAAVFALGRRAGRRRLPFLVAATSDGGRFHDPLEMDEAALAALLEASDLSADPGAALGRALAEEAAAPRDVVLLTHPRNLDEPAVRAAARTLRPGSRLFTAAVDGDGDVVFSELRRGAPVRLSRFHVDLTRTAPPPERPASAGGRRPWAGDVEVTPFPFVFGVADRGPFHFDFDGGGERLVTATADGMLHATPINGSAVEVLPRALIEGRVLTSVQRVMGVADGVAVVGVAPSTFQGDVAVVTSPSANVAVVAHYDFARRACAVHTLGWVTDAYGSWHYFRDLHSVAWLRRDQCRAVDLATGGRILAAGAPDDRPSRAGEACDRARKLIDPRGRKETCWLNSPRGEITLKGADPPWQPFVPLSDGRPALQGSSIVGYQWRSRILAALIRNDPAATPGQGVGLHLFRGPEGTPLAVYPQTPPFTRFALSDDGRLLARQLPTGQLEVREVAGGPPSCVTLAGGFHGNTAVELGDRWLLLRVRNTVRFVRWDAGRLVCRSARGDAGAVARGQLAGGSLSPEGVAAGPTDLPDFASQGRFVRVARRTLIALVDGFGETALFEPDGRLVCMFFLLRGQLAAWAPPEVRYGPASLLGASPTPAADEKIGRALLAAWERAAGRSP